MHNTTSSDRDYTRGINTLARICNKLIDQRAPRGIWETPGDAEAFTLLFNKAKGLEQDRLIPVYRAHQPTVFSCMDEESCTQCRRRRYESCPRAVPAPPAYTLPRSAALKLINSEQAQFVNMNRALRLTFDKPAQLRGTSTRIDERFLIAFALGERWAVAIAGSWETNAKPLGNEYEFSGPVPVFAL